MKYLDLVAFIPARGGSKRVPRKNLRPLAGQPLFVYSILAAVQSGVFSRILVSTDDDEVESIAMPHGVEVRKVGPPCHVDDCADIIWVRDALQHCGSLNAFAILRPSSPFRTAETIRRAWDQFKRDESHSLRAVEPVKQTPYKMWTWKGAGYPIKPLLDEHLDGQPLHSMPTQCAPRVYIQNASLEMAWSYVIESFGTISGTKVSPFFTEGHEGFDINTESDWAEAERIAAANPEYFTPIPSLT